MKFHINGNKVHLTPIDEMADPLFKQQPESFRALPRHVYTWDCQFKTHTPDPRPTHHIFDADLFFIRPIPATGSAKKKAELEAKDRDAVMQALGVKKPQHLQKALNFISPPRNIKIKHNILTDPYVPHCTVEVTVIEHYLRFEMRLKKSDRRPLAYFQFPMGYTMSSRIHQVCQNKVKDGTDPKTSNPLHVLKQGGIKYGRFKPRVLEGILVDGYQKELPEVRKRHQERKELEDYKKGRVKDAKPPVGMDGNKKG